MNKKQAARIARDALERAKEAAGGPVAMAKMLGGITSQAISQWQRVPAERVRRVADLTGVPDYELRPDMYQSPVSASSSSSTVSA